MKFATQISPLLNYYCKFDFFQDFEALPYEKASYGKFNIGDSYIVLNVRKYFWFIKDTILLICSYAPNNIDKLYMFYSLKDVLCQICEKFIS